ncbi:hypothetical protein [Variovorax sp. 38R]|uniref:hypothetical protein n=1 Tax=Variovorax sp. 38R TaxID=2774875 RepID=UPI001782FB5E|nr:hypothetical protein [Variovorax sp. 38R]QOF79512.1 hypothetical protein IG196_03670 [Variovorax sp. 38R]
MQITYRQAVPADTPACIELRGAARVYRHLGWKPTGEFDAAGDEVLAYVPS